MKLLIIRHGDPDYSIDSLTPDGWQEAELLSERMARLDIKDYYVSPLGRAKDTISLTLEKTGRTAEVLDWLQEFPVQTYHEELGKEKIVWDWLPAQWTCDPAHYDKDRWADTGLLKNTETRQVYEKVCRGLDELLSRYGYVREENYYRAIKPNRDTIALFCHFGLECVLISHLLGISPMVLWHGTCAPPSSVTSLVTEERREGIAAFRMNFFGDTSHLYIAGREPGFSGRFCETFDCREERHD